MSAKCGTTNENRRQYLSAYKSGLGLAKFLGLSYLSETKGERVGR